MKSWIGILLILSMSACVSRMYYRDYSLTFGPTEKVSRRTIGAFLEKEGLKPAPIEEENPLAWSFPDPLPLTVWIKARGPHSYGLSFSTSRVSKSQLQDAEKATDLLISKLQRKFPRLELERLQ